MVRLPVPEAKNSVTPDEDTVVSRTMPYMESTNNVTEIPCNPPTQTEAAGSTELSVPISVAVGAYGREATLPVTAAMQG